MDQAERFGGRNLGWLARTRHRLSRAGWLRETQERADGRCAESRDTENRSQYHGGQFLFVNAGNEKTDSAAERPKKRLIVRPATCISTSCEEHGRRQDAPIDDHDFRCGQARDDLGDGMATPLLDRHQALAAPHTEHREMVTELGWYRGLGTPIKMSRTPGGTRS